MHTDKFTNLVHYIIFKCAENPSSLGAIKLNKILWFADKFAYLDRGETITGARYVKRRFGPVPDQIVEATDSLEAEEKIEIEEKRTFVYKQRLLSYKQRLFYSKLPANTSGFDEQELELVDALIDVICKEHTAMSISDLSHDLVWEAASEGEEMPMSATLVAEPAEINQSDVEWAKKAIARFVA